mmetsp:Transcript_76319/g.182674  ORF Transcript_76319/g.182674 Transcript_76319/m.182674 type:complete len:236 (+) Transcript_76319:421-1128(+)
MAPFRRDEGISGSKRSNEKSKRKGGNERRNARLVKPRRSVPGFALCRSFRGKERKRTCESLKCSLWERKTRSRKERIQCGGNAKKLPGGSRRRKSGSVSRRSKGGRIRSCRRSVRPGLASLSGLPDTSPRLGHPHHHPRQALPLQSSSLRGKGIPGTPGTQAFGPNRLTSHQRVPLRHPPWHSACLPLQRSLRSRTWLPLSLTCTPTYLQNSGTGYRFEQYTSSTTLKNWQMSHT